MSNAAIAISAYIGISGAAVAVPFTTAFTIVGKDSWLPLVISSQAMNAVQPMVRAKINPKYQGSHFLPMLQMDSRSGGCSFIGSAY